MENEFINYEQALALKELGFDEPCILLYRGLDTQPVCQMDYEFKTEKNSDYNDETNYWLTVPTFSQAFRWFRDKYGLFVAPNVISYEGGPWLWTLDINSLPLGTDLGGTDDYETYEEAESACLKKLIEIVKQ